MSRITPTDIKSKAMKELGLYTYKPDRHKVRKLRPVTTAVISAKDKTATMLLIEAMMRQPIDKVIMSGSLSIVAKNIKDKAGVEVDTSTISRWIKRFKLRYTATNLPSCDGCQRYGPACDAGICYVLIELELYDLVPLKKQEVLSEVAEI